VQHLAELEPLRRYCIASRETPSPSHSALLPSST
jgi:hypothetical protein